MTDGFSWWPLPDGVVDTPMNRAEIADYMGVSTNTIDTWIKSGMPVEQEGGNGKAYVFALAECCRWRQERDEDTARQREAARRAINIREQAFLNLPENSEDLGLSARDRREMAQADLLFNQAALARRRLCRFEDVLTVMEAIMVAAREGLGALPDRVERELNLSPRQIGQLVKMTDQTLNDMVEKLKAAQLDGFDDEAEGAPNELLI